jgi:UDP-N-acetylglucosamine:LPS N-acetylglucosamine transferase
VRLLEALWKERRPDLVVSLIPNFNRAIGDSLRRALPGTPWVTILTDIADYPPHFWIERESDYVVCGSERAAGQARAAGRPEDHVFRTSGMILHPRYYEQPALDRDAERSKLGLRPDLPTGLVLFGGQGSGVMLEIARRLEASNLDLQLIFVCGHNQRIFRALTRRRGRLPRHVEGFTAEVPYFMRLADFLIGKPGPGSISEALATGLPVIVERNAFTLPQERYNAEWIVKRGVGLVVPNFRHIDRAVRDLLAPGAFADFRARAAAIENRAVFEIPDILAALLEKSKP